MVLNKYRNIGFKLTPQRMAILDYLERNNLHPSAEEIHRGVLKQFQTMSLATVYTTLAVLKEKGYLLELTIDTNKRRYDCNNEIHNHLICISCKRIIDIPVAYEFDLPEKVKQDFSVLHARVEFYGLCPSCKEEPT